MIPNQELTIDDYLSILRRRMRVILIPALIAPALGFAISYLFSAKYTSTSTVSVDGQKMNDIKPVGTEDVMQRVTTLQQEVLSSKQLQPLVERLNLAKAGTSLDDMLDEIRKGVDIAPVESTSPGARRKPGQSDVPGFQVKYTTSQPHVAQQVCNEITSMLLEENLKSRQQDAQDNTEFLGQQVEEAKRNLDEQDGKLAAFQRQYVGQLPSDSDNNLKILMGLKSQLDASTPTLNRAQQDKAFAESILAEHLAAWKTSQSSTSPQALEQELSSLKSQLRQLQARYTDDHPDVVKTKADIAELRKQLALVNSAKLEEPGDKLSSATEPPEIRALRVQIHQYEDAISQTTREQKHLQEQIKLYQGRVALSPAVEEQYKQLTRDYDTAQKFYNDLLADERRANVRRRSKFSARVSNFTS